MAPVKTVPEPDPDANCRLRNGLNSDCLLEIFEYLEQDDLVTLSRINDHYKQLITNCIISKKTIEISGNCVRSNAQLLENFGRKVKHIKFVGDRVRFEHFSQQIVKHCTENQIKTIDINFIWSNSDKSKCRCPKTMAFVMDNNTSTEAAKKYFRNVEEVSIRHANARLGEILGTLFGESENLRVLKLIESKIDDRLMSWKSSQQLTELHLIESKVGNEERFIEFLRSQSKLERFISHGGYYSIRRVGEALAVNCSHTLQVFCDFGSVNRNGNRSETDYDFISKFVNIKELKLTSITQTGIDLHRPLMRLAKKRSIQKLGIYQNAKHLNKNGADIIESIAEFKSLKCLEISMEEFTLFDDSKQLEFLFGNSELIFKNVETLILSGSNGFKSAIDIIGKVPRLKRLQIDNLERKYWLIDSRRIISTIANIVEQRNIKNDEVTMIVNPQQWCDFAIFDINFIVLLNEGTPIEMSNFKIGKTVKIPRINYIK